MTDAASTQRKGETKRQHYVPRFVLRKFSPDETRISLIVLDSGKRINNAPLKGQCYEDYFYGADNVMEKSFAAGEGKTSGYLGDLSREWLGTLPREALEDLRYFAWYQLARTKGAAEHVNRFVGAIIKTAMKGTLKLNKETELKPSDLDLVEVGFEDAQNEAIWMASKSTPLLLDLEVKFITTERTPGFIIADHPVAMYNQFAEHHDILKHYPTATGLALKGLQLFMPLSPSVMLGVYDPGVYEYGGKGLVCRAGPADVAYLNRMQAINAMSCIYFDPRRVTNEVLADVQAARNHHPSLLDKLTWTSPITQRPDGKMSQFVVTAKREIRIGSKLSFIRTTDGHSYESHQGPAVPVRHPELVDLAHAYGALLEQKVSEARASREQALAGPSAASGATT